MAGKAEMLARIRAALGRQKGSEADAARSSSGRSLPASRPTAPEHFDAEVVDRFRDEVEKVGGRVALVQSPEEVRTYLEELLPSDGDEAVAVSDGAGRLDPGLREWLTSRHLRVIPSLTEFAESETRQGKSESPPELPPAQKGAESRLTRQYKTLLFEASLGVTTADYAIADTGTVVLISRERQRGGAPDNRDPDFGPGRDQHRLISLVPAVHICLLDSSRILGNLAELITRVHDEFYSIQAAPLAMTFITGPSRTADIELTLTRGVHGPRELHVLLFTKAAVPGLRGLGRG